MSLIDLGEEDDKYCILTYVDQAIVNPVNFPAFELAITDTNSMTQIHSALTRTKGLCESPTKMDITGNRVSVSLSLIDIVSTITNTIRPLLTGYNATTNKYKTWKNQPDRYCSENRRGISKDLHSDTDDIAAYSSFQRLIVEKWNPRSIDASKLLIPPVSLRDEITTDGYGMAIIEILCLSGVLKKVKLYTDVYEWELNKDWDKKRIFMHGWSIP